MTCARHFDRVPSRSVLGGCLTVSSCHAYQKYLKAPCILVYWAQGCDIVSLVVCLGDRSEGFPRTQFVALSVRSGRGPVSGGAFSFLSFFLSFFLPSFLSFFLPFFSHPESYLKIKILVGKIGHSNVLGEWCPGGLQKCKKKKKN